MSDFPERVRAAVRAIPPGRVSSYGRIAAQVGRPRAARQVGRALHALPDDADVPWWRVLTARGEIAIRGDGHAARVQRALLEREGIRFGPDGRVDPDRFTA